MKTSSPITWHEIDHGWMDTDYGLSSEEVKRMEVENKGLLDRMKYEGLKHELDLRITDMELACLKMENEIQEMERMDFVKSENASEKSLELILVENGTLKGSVAFSGMQSWSYSGTANTEYQRVAKVGSAQTVIANMTEYAIADSGCNRDVASTKRLKG